MKILESGREIMESDRTDRNLDTICNRIKALVFSGTSEGKSISRWLKDNGIDVTVSVATEYGSRDSDEGLETHFGSYGGVEGISEELRRGRYDVVIDATHPYALSISAHVKEACDLVGMEYVRISRVDSTILGRGDIIYANDIDDAVRILSGMDGTILVTTGVKDLHRFTDIPNYRKRVVARILSVRESIDKALDLGFEGANLICARGPFNEEFNHALIEQTGADILVTKDTGSEGGFYEKLRAAERAGITTLVVRRPDDHGMSLSEAMKVLGARFNIDSETGSMVTKPSMAIVGIGMGGNTLTLEARNRIESADLLIGADRMLASVSSVGKHVMHEYRSKEILSFLDEHPEYERPAVLVSGDVGFYSAAKKLIESVDKDRYQLEVYCGISSLVYLCSRMAIPWQDIRALSAHGKDANVVGAVRTEKSIFTLLTGSDGARNLCDKLIRFGLDDVTVIIGQDLGTCDERIFKGNPSEIRDSPFSELCAAIVLNNNPDLRMQIGMNDDDFIRGDAPMTKSEVRSLSIVKMKLQKDSIVYDIGAGTGSVSIEMARVADEGAVYAIEKDTSALELIELNKKKFATPNVTIVPGVAPYALEELPAPSHAFIGGSSGNLNSIVETLLRLNPDVRIVINAVTLETMNEIMDVIRDFEFTQSEIVHLSVSKAKGIGRYHLMTAFNPVYVAVMQR